MTNTRYMVVDHARSESSLTREDGVLKGQIAIHSLLTNYHWARITEDHVLLIGSFSIANTTKLRNHAKVSVLPHANSQRNLKSHLSGRRPDHYQALVSKLGIDDTCFMAHLLDKLENALGPVFAPQK